MSETKVQRNYKDTFFRMLFKDKENLLSLYNALNGTDYTDVEELEITGGFSENESGGGDGCEYI